MATQQVTLALLMKLMDQVTGPLNNINKSINGTTAGLKSLGGIAAKAFGVIGVGLGAAAIIENMRETEESTRQLTLAIKNLGGQSGVTVKQVQGLAEELQRTTQFSDEAVQDATTTLLRFGAVTKDTLKPTLEIITDVAAGMRTDLASASYMVARALADPERGLRQLRAAGVVFTTEQTKAIKKLVETGQEAKASAIILGELSSIYKGAAADSVNTFTGAMERLKNVTGNLLEGPEGGLTGVTSAINEMSKVLGDPKTKAAADALFGAIIKGVAAAVKVTGALINNLVQVADNLTALVNNDAVGKIKSQIDFFKQIQGESDTLGGGRALVFGEYAPNGVAGYLSREEITARIQDLESQLSQVRSGGPQSGRVYKPKPLGKLPGADALGKVGSEKGDLSEIDPAGELLDAKRRAKLEEDTRTESRKIVDTYEKQVASIKQIEREGVIDHVEALKRLKAVNDEFNKDYLSDVEVTAEKFYTVVRTPIMEFTDALKAGLENAVQTSSFSLKKIVANIIAALTQKSLFRAIDNLGSALSKALSGSSRGSGFGNFLAGVGKFLFGSKAGGGRVDGPTWVGENGRELFVPSTGGTIYNGRALAAMGGRGGSVTHVTNHYSYSISGVETQQVVAYIERTRREDQKANVKMLERNGLGRMR